MNVVMLPAWLVLAAIWSFNTVGHPGCPDEINIWSYVKNGAIRPDVYAAVCNNYVMLAYGRDGLAINVLLFENKDYFLSSCKKWEVKKSIVALFKASPYTSVIFNSLRNRYYAIVQKCGGEVWQQEGRYFYKINLERFYEYFA